MIYIDKCEHCGHNNFGIYYISTAPNEYFRECKECVTLNYKKFPLHLPTVQYKDYVELLNEM